MKHFTPVKGNPDECNTDFLMSVQSGCTHLIHLKCNFSRVAGVVHFPWAKNPTFCWVYRVILKIYSQKVLNLISIALGHPVLQSVLVNVMPSKVRVFWTVKFTKSGGDIYRIYIGRDFPCQNYSHIVLILTYAFPKGPFPITQIQTLKISH